MDVYLNGEKLCRAAVGTKGVLNTMVDVVGRKGDRYDMRFRVGGLENEELLMWLNRELRVGDEIRVRIVETLSGDEPAERSVKRSGR